MTPPRSPLRSRSPGGAVVVVAALVLSTGFAGCTFAPPKPWEKGELAKPAMQFDADRLAARTLEHVYQSKEAATGGYGVGGVGCGCN